jgi:hypothetical protein
MLSVLGRQSRGWKSPNAAASPKPFLTPSVRLSERPARQLPEVLPPQNRSVISRHHTSSTNVPGQHNHCSSAIGSPPDAAAATDPAAPNAVIVAPSPSQHLPGDVPRATPLPEGTRRLHRGVVLHGALASAARHSDVVGGRPHGPRAQGGTADQRRLSRSPLPLDCLTTNWHCPVSVSPHGATRASAVPHGKDWYRILRRAFVESATILRAALIRSPEPLSGLVKHRARRACARSLWVLRWRSHPARRGIRCQHGFARGPYRNQPGIQ